MLKAEKERIVEELTERLKSTPTLFVADYRGLSVTEIDELRTQVIQHGARFTVVKNTLSKIAARDAGVTGVDELLAGPSAIAFVKGDTVDAAKAIRAFAKENPALVIKGGYMDGKTLSAADVQKIADLESREVLLSKLAGAMKAKQSQAAALFLAPLSKTARTLAALQDKLAADPSAAAAPAEAAPAAEAPAAEGRFAVSYQLLSVSRNTRLRVRCRCAAGEPPMLDSVTGVWAAADWYEREAFDLYGILFRGHPDLRRILTDYGFIGHPFRKDFPLSGHVEVRYDPSRGRVVNEPVSIAPRVTVPKVIRKGRDPGDEGARGGA